MNTNLILKSTGKEFVIINELVKFIKYSDSCVFISKSNPLIYKMGDSSIIMSTENKNDIILDDKIGDIIKIIDISEQKNKLELDVSVGIIRLYKIYEFKVSLANNKYKIVGKFKTRETNPISSIRMAEFGFGYIRKIYEKIESINLIDSDIFKNDKVILKNYTITIDSPLDNIDNIDLDGIKLIVKRFTDIIDNFYKEGMTKVSPKDSDK
jgi:hypothetical protein